MSDIQAAINGIMCPHKPCDSERRPTGSQWATGLDGWTLHAIEALHRIATATDADTAKLRVIIGAKAARQRKANENRLQ